MLALALALTLSWVDNSQVEDGFYVARKLQSDKTFVLIATLPPNTTRFVDRNVKKNRTYCYQIIDFKGQERGYSNVDCQKNIR
jgi:hypothetical protein